MSNSVAGRTNEVPDETIVALASGRGEAGVAVIRVSGPAAVTLKHKIFKPAGKNAEDPGKLVYGSVLDSADEIIDDCLTVMMLAPHSFTGEDVVEIQCHGSQAVVRRIIDRCLECGARLADPGEFSKRAFLNGKMDLAQAEALSDLIAARSEAARKLALRQLRGGLSARLRRLYSELIDAAAEIEAHIDFPEEDIPALARDRILGRMESAGTEMQRLLAGHQRARVQSEGARVILAGEPNAGKSSLFNALVGRERAIVSPHPGTTRDTIEATLEISGLAITLVDTAGIRTDAGEIEQIGIDRTHEEIRDADLVLHLSENLAGFECGPDLSTSDGARILRVLTKQDDLLLADAEDGTERQVEDPIRVSSTTGAGLSYLERLIAKHLGADAGISEDVEMSRIRHAECLQAALQSLDGARETFMAGQSGDLVMVDLRDALSSIGEILGERLDEQILDRIFSTFCLGK